MSPRQILISIALLFLVGGLVLGLTSYSIYNDELDEVNCGSVLRPEHPLELSSDSCDSQVSDAKPFTYGALGIAALAFVAAFMASNETPKRREPEVE